MRWYRESACPGGSFHSKASHKGCTHRFDITSLPGHIGAMAKTPKFRAQALAKPRPLPGPRVAAPANRKPRPPKRPPAHRGSVRPRKPPSPRPAPWANSHPPTSPSRPARPPTPQPKRPPHPNRRFPPSARLAPARPWRTRRKARCWQLFSPAPTSAPTAPRRCSTRSYARIPPARVGRDADVHAAQAGTPREERGRHPLQARQPLRTARRPASGHLRSRLVDQRERTHRRTPRRHGLGQDVHDGAGDQGNSAPRPHSRTQQDARRPALWRNEELLPPRTASSTSSPTTTTTSPKPTCRAPTPTSRKKPTSTSRSIACATPPRERCSNATTSSSSPPCRASTVSVRLKPTRR